MSDFADSIQRAVQRAREIHSERSKAEEQERLAKQRAFSPFIGFVQKLFSEAEQAGGPSFAYVRHPNPLGHHSSANWDRVDPRRLRPDAIEAMIVALADQTLDWQRGERPKARPDNAAPS